MFHLEDLGLTKKTFASGLFVTKKLGGGFFFFSYFYHVFSILREDANKFNKKCAKHDNRRTKWRYVYQK